ncbi:MAG: hypothetical protein LBU50_01650 [Cellulomonas sp.]|jgi:NADH:ubiquinone oxidoreductase subunit D|nr:hypothetical protein [Cellulomonas sp.]
MKQPKGTPQEDLMSDETTEPFVPQQKQPQPPSSDQLEELWEDEPVTDFSALCEGLNEAALNVDW